MANRFASHKKYILRNRRIAVFTLILGELYLVLFLWAAFKNPLVVWIVLFPLIVIIDSAAFIVATTRLLKQFSKIQTSKANEIKIFQPKINFLKTPEFTARHVRMKFYGIIIIVGKQKFYYLFGDCYNYNAKDLKKIYAKFNNEISIQYYEGTTIIKMIQNDPHFMKIKAFYE